MATITARAFGGNIRDAVPAAPRYVAPMAIDRMMGGRDWAILAFLSVLWGGSFFFIGVAVREVSPFTFVLVRVALAAAALWAFLLIRRMPVRLPREALGAMLVLALLNNAVPFSLFAWSQTQIASGLASILNATTPIWGVIAAHLFTRDERITPAKLAGVLLGFGGVALMVGADLLGEIGSGLAAQLACLAATFCYALAGVWARRFKAMGVAPATVATGQLTATALVMLPVALIVDQPWLRPAPSAQAWTAIAGLALLGTALAYILYFRLIESAGATNALLVTLLIPPTAILLGWLFLGERLEPRDLAGLALIALGLAAIDGRLVSLARLPRPAPPPDRFANPRCR
jgi:drug/metabolite transporter (DMT)-like permease